MSTMTGSCLCGGVRYEAGDSVLGVNYCHCIKCRKASGSAFATSVAVLAGALRITAGLELLRGFESTPGKTRHFCGRCGSPIYSASAESPDRVYLRAGTLDGAQAVTPQVHIHVASKAPWYPILDGLPQRKEQEDLWF